MRYIRKGNAPYYLEQSHQKPPTTSEEARSRWKSFSHKPSLSDKLNKEQYGLCAYSELRPDEEGIGTHIEHIKPKSLYPKETFDYYNIVLCALNSEEDLKNMNRKNIFGGHAKQKQYDENRFISCLYDQCEAYFQYLSDGRVVPSDSLELLQKERAQYTIDLLNLNCEYLKNKRKNWIDELEQIINELLTDDHALRNIAELELCITNDKLRQFHTAAYQRFGHLGRQIIKHNCPELL